MWQSILSEFLHQPLGAIYYLFGILVFLFGVVKSLNLIYVVNSLNLIYLELWLAVIITITLPILVSNIFRSRNEDLKPLNPNWDNLLQSRDVEIRKDGRRITHRDELRAVSYADEINYRFKLTGIASLTAKLVEPSSAKLSSPVYHYEYVLYKVKLSKGLARDQITEVVLKIEVVDPACTMKPFQGLTQTAFRKYHHSTCSFRFPVDKPENVCFASSGLFKRDLTETIPLFPDENGCYNHSIEVTQHRNHIYSWSW